MAKEKASEGKVLQEVDEGDAHISILDTLEVDAESDGAPDMSDLSSITCFRKPTFFLCCG